jgi:putative sigma-54 modulation protein
MLINITVKGVEVPPNLRELAEHKLAKLERLVRTIDTEDIPCSRDPQWRLVEVMVNANGLLIRGEDRAADVLSALDSLVGKLERRIKKSRSKQVQRHREAPETRDAWAAALEAEGTEEVFESKLVRSKRFALKPMSPEEAAAEMDLLGHDFFVFRNAETEQVNVLYRRRDGHYGLIEPEF